MIKKAVVHPGLTPDVNGGKKGWFIKNGESVFSNATRVKELPEVPTPELKNESPRNTAGK